MSAWSERFKVNEDDVAGYSDTTMEALDHCRSGCPSKDHASWGECLRAARVGVAGGESAGPQF